MTRRSSCWLPSARCSVWCSGSLSPWPRCKPPCTAQAAFNTEIFATAVDAPAAGSELVEVGLSQTNEVNPGRRGLSVSGSSGVRAGRSRRRRRRASD